MNDEEFLLYQSKITSVSKMLSSVAHKWRQPLNEINAIVSNIDLDYNYNLMSKKSLDLQLKNIENITRQLSNTLDDFRDFVEGERVKSIFNIKDGIDGFYSLIEGSIKSHNINCLI